MIDPVLASTSNKLISLDPSITAPSSEIVGVRSTNSAIDSEILCRYDKQSTEHQAQNSSATKKQ